MNSRLGKRIRQVVAVLRHPSAIMSRYDTPWDNALFSDVRRLYERNEISSCLFDDLAQTLWPGETITRPRLRYLYDAHRTSGSVSPLELRIIGDICRHVKPRHVLEIGTFEGRTTLNLAIAAPEARVYTLNLPPAQCQFEVGRLFKDTDEAKRITQIFGNSRHYDFSALPQMDLILVDGDHSFEGAAADSDSAFSSLSENGFILWHDFDTCHLGTTKAVLDAVRRHGCAYRAIEGTSLAISFAHQAQKPT